MEAHKAESFKTLLTLTEDYFSKRHSERISRPPIVLKLWAARHTQLLETTGSVILEKLKIDLFPDEMKKIYEQFELIVLRKPKSNNLFLYCGNDPVASSAMFGIYTDGVRKWHSHKDLDTIDSCLLMNPSMVGVWPSRTILNYLKSEEKKYDSVNCEVMPLFNLCDSEYLIQASMQGMTEVLKVGGITYDINSKNYMDREFDDLNDVVKFLEIANDHGFEAVLQTDSSIEEYETKRQRFQLTKMSEGPFVNRIGNFHSYKKDSKRVIENLSKLKIEESVTFFCANKGDKPLKNSMRLSYELGDQFKVSPKYLGSVKSEENESCFHDINIMQCTVTRIKSS